MRRSGVCLIALALVALSAQSAVARPGWKRHIDRIVRGHSIGVSVAEAGDALYRHADKRKRIPASNQKVLLSMALLDLVGPEETVVTPVAAEGLAGSVVRGDLWLLGRGDPTLTGGGAYSRSLPLRPSRIAAIADAVRAAGIRRISGSVMGSTGYFTRDWYAPGWKSFFPTYYVPLPSALAFEGNSYKGRHIDNPEWRAARSLTRRLRAKGVRVAGRPGAGTPPAGTTVVARAESEPLQTLLTFMNRQSSNFFAEVLGKRLAATRDAPPGSIAKGAGVIARWTARRGVDAVARDSSGLSYENRISPRGLVDLLGRAEVEDWGPALRLTLPVPGQGTLDDRLAGVKLRAKTGTLDGISALSGWVWLERTRTWAEFSILSSGMPKSRAVAIEDRIVRIIARAAGPATGSAGASYGASTTGTRTTWSGEPSSAEASYTSITPSVSSTTWNGMFLL